MSAVAAVITLAGVILGGRWLTGDKDQPPSDPPPVTSTTAAPTTVPPTPTPAPTPTPTPTPTPGGTFLDSLTPVAGSTVPLPAALDAADFRHAVSVSCPDNQAGRTAQAVKYDLNKRYRKLQATLSGWSEGKDPFRVQVQVFTITTLRDGTPRRDLRATQTATVNQGAVTLTAPITAAGDDGRAGTGADQVELSIGCEQPHDAVILGEARLS